MKKLPKYLTTVTAFSKWLTLILFITLPIAGFFFGMKYQQMLSTAPSILIEKKEKEIKATYECAQGKSITTVYFDDKVKLNLSDGREFTFNQAMAASGARFANQDQSLVFWNKGNTAFFQEGEKITYQDCLTKD